MFAFRSTTLGGGCRFHNLPSMIGEMSAGDLGSLGPMPSHQTQPATQACAGHQVAYNRDDEQY